MDGLSAKPAPPHTLCWTCAVCVPCRGTRERMSARATRSCCVQCSMGHGKTATKPLRALQINQEGEGTGGEGGEAAMPSQPFAWAIK